MTKTLKTPSSRRQFIRGAAAAGLAAPAIVAASSVRAQGAIQWRMQALWVQMA